MNLEQFAGVNAGYVLELYERYRHNPESVDPNTRRVFESWIPADAAAEAGAAPVSIANLHTIVGAADLAESIRRYGHLAARIDPARHPSRSPTFTRSSAPPISRNRFVATVISPHASIPSARHQLAIRRYHHAPTASPTTI